jgi:hypothetical protein
MSSIQSELNDITITIDKLRAKIDALESRNERLDVLGYLNECGGIVNAIFKREYKKKFGRTRGLCIPNIGDYISDPPKEEDDDYSFWDEFRVKYPGSDNEKFRALYQEISRDMDQEIYGLITVDKDRFDNSVKIAYAAEYDNKKQLYNDYRDWIIDLSDRELRSNTN